MAKQKTKITITVLLILAMTILVLLLGFGLMIVFALDVTSGRVLGIYSIPAFLLAALIFGYCLNFVTDYIKRLWE
jgi:hypothetical protein